jgi:hypothetical protein
MEHAVGTDEGLLPRFLAEETVVDHQPHRLGDELVEKLDGDLKGLVRILAKQDSLVADGVLADGGEAVAQAAFGGEDPLLKAKEQGEVSVARMVKVTQRLGASPAVGDLPTEEEEDGEGIEGLPPPGRGPAQQLCQDGPQGGEID